MASRIGVRDLKYRASEIVRTVQEEAAEYIVTLCGKPVAMLRPLTGKSERELQQEERQEALAKLDRLADQIARAWRSPKGALDLVEEQRR